MRTSIQQPNVQRDRARRKPLSKRTMSRLDRSAHHVLLAPTLLAIGAITLYPLIYGLVASFRGVSLSDPDAGFVGFRNYTEILSDPETWHSIWLTIIFTAVSVAFSFALGLAGALALNLDFRFRGIVRSLFIIPWAVPAFVAALTWGWIYNDQFGILSALFSKVGLHAPQWLGSEHAMQSLIIVMVWKSFPFQLVMLLAGLQSIPPELYEAARVDGASVVKQFSHITLPLLMPISLVALFMAVVNAFQYFPIPWILTAGGPSNATNVIAISSYNLAFNAGEIGLGAAVAGVMCAVTTLGAIWYVRYYSQNVGRI